MRRLVISIGFITNPVFVTGTGAPVAAPGATVLDLDPNIQWCYRVEVSSYDGAQEGGELMTEVAPRRRQHTT